MAKVKEESHPNKQAVTADFKTLQNKINTGRELLA
jgi:hypothetical protein